MSNTLSWPRSRTEDASPGDASAAPVATMIIGRPDQRIDLDTGIADQETRDYFALDPRAERVLLTPRCSGGLNAFHRRFGLDGAAS